MQGVVFNAHYLAYVDDATDTWFRERLGDFEESGFDCMVKRATIEWAAPARFRDEIEISIRVARFGTSSFDIEAVGSVADRHIFTATLLYVSTVPGEPRPTPIPEAVRSALAG